MKAFTTAQQEAAERVYDILREHFEASVFAVVTDCASTDNQEAHTVYYHGGRIRAIGLAAMVTHKLTTKEPDAEEDGAP